MASAKRGAGGHVAPDRPASMARCPPGVSAVGCLAQGGSAGQGIYGTGPLRKFAPVSQDAHCAGQEAMSPVAARMPVP